MTSHKCDPVANLQNDVIFFIEFIKRIIENATFIRIFKDKYGFNS